MEPSTLAAWVTVGAASDDSDEQPSAVDSTEEN